MCSMLANSVFRKKNAAHGRRKKKGERMDQRKGRRNVHHLLAGTHRQRKLIPKVGVGKEKRGKGESSLSHRFCPMSVNAQIKQDGEGGKKKKRGKEEMHGKPHSSYSLIERITGNKRTSWAGHMGKKQRRGIVLSRPRLLLP